MHPTHSKSNFLHGFFFNPTNLLAKQTGPQEKFSSAKPQAPAMGLFMVRNHRRFHQLPTPISGSTLVHVGTVCSGGPLNYKGKEFFQAWKTIDHLLFKLGFSAATLRELLTVSLSLWRKRRWVFFAAMSSGSVFDLRMEAVSGDCGGVGNRP